MTENKAGGAQEILAKLGHNDKIVAGCCAAVVVLCFLPWYSASGGGMSMSVNALDMWQGTMVFLLAAATAVVVVGVKAGFIPLDAKLAAKVPMFGPALAALFNVLFLLKSTGDVSGIGFDAGKTLWPMVTLVLLVVAAFFGFQQSKSASAD